MTKPYNPAAMISASTTTSAGSGKTLPLDPIYTVVGAVTLAILIPMVIMAYLGRGSTKQLRAEQETLRLTRATTDAKTKALVGQTARQDR